MENNRRNVRGRRSGLVPSIRPIGGNVAPVARDPIEVEAPIPVATDRKQYRRLQYFNGPTVVLISEIENKPKNPAGPSKGKKHKEATVEYDYFEFPEIPSSSPSVLDWKSEARDVLRAGGRKLLKQKSRPSDGDTPIHSFACAVAVKAGNLDDPREFRGLAHLIEHVLFRQELDKALDSVGAEGNAITESEVTSYYISAKAIGEERVDYVMRRFARMLRIQNIPITAIKREVLALELEYRNTEVDVVHRSDMLKACPTLEDHPVKFQWGNEEWLFQNTENDWNKLKKALHEFIDTFYCPLNVVVVLQASLELDKLQTIATTHFGTWKSVRRRELEVIPRYMEPFSGKNFRRTMYTIKPHSSADIIYMTWQLPPNAYTNYKTKPVEYIGSIISSSIAGGLVHNLINKKWILSLKCGPQNFFQSRYGALFTIKMEMTQIGMEQQNDVFKLVFTYIDEIKQNGVDENLYQHQAFLLKNKLMADTAIRPALEHVDVVAQSVLLYDHKDVLKGAIEFLEYNQLAIRTVLQELNRRTVNIMRVSRMFGSIQFENLLPRTNCYYKENLVPSRDRDNLTSTAHLQLPTEINPYYSEIDFLSTPTVPARARAITKLLTNRKRLSSKWLPKTLPVPMSEYECEIIGNIGPNLELAQARGMLEMFSLAINLVLYTPIQMAGEVSVERQLVTTQNGSFKVIVVGFDEAAKSLFIQIVQAIMDKDGSRKHVFGHFDSVKEQMLKFYDKTLNNPQEHAGYLLDQIILVGCSSIESMQSAVCQVEADTFVEFINAYFADPEVILGISGNASKDLAQDVTDEFCNLDFQKLRRKGFNPRLPLVALKPSRYIYQTYSLRKTNPICELLLWIPLYNLDDKQLSIALCLVTALKSALYMFIRARPLGYNTNVTIGDWNDQYGIQLVVTYDAAIDKDLMVEQMDAFLSNFDLKNREKLQHTDKLRAWTSSQPHLEELLPFEYDDLVDFVEKHIDPTFPENFIGLYIQVVCKDKGEIDDSWDDYRRPRTVTAVDQSGRITNQNTIYIGTATDLNTNNQPSIP